MTECYECARLAELMAENSQLRVKLDELTCNDALAPEKAVTQESAVANDANADSREKLEAEAFNLFNEWPTLSDDAAAFLTGCVAGFLDRQAAITEREREQHWLEIVGASANCNLELTNRTAELQAKVDELTAQLESAHAKNRALKAHIGKMQEGRHGWHVKYPELERKNVDLQSDYDAIIAKCAELCALCGFTMVDSAGEVIE